MNSPLLGPSTALGWYHSRPIVPARPTRSVPSLVVDDHPVAAELQRRVVLRGVEPEAGKAPVGGVVVGPAKAADEHLAVLAAPQPLIVADLAQAAVQRVEVLQPGVEQRDRGRQVGRHLRRQFGPRIRRNRGGGAGGEGGMGGPGGEGGSGSGGSGLSGETKTFCRR